MNWYQTGFREVLHELGVSEHGLTDAEASERAPRYGPNKLAEEEKISRFKILLHQFTSPLIYILLIASVVTILLEEYIDSGVILAVVMLNAIIGFIQEYKAEESVRALKKMVVPKAMVIRNGREKEINSEGLVPGDMVLIASGSKVPADLRLIHTIELKIEEAMLTGESVPGEKTSALLRQDNLPPGDQKNMAFMGTIVVSGRAKGVVVATGYQTLLGQIAKDVKEVVPIRTPLQDKLDRFARLIGLVVVIFSIMVFGVGVLLGESASKMFMTAVATAVSAIPEGLPIAVTVAMAIGVARMARRNAIIRKLPAVETLGSTTVIGSDKTGTLTKNEMTVKMIYDGSHIYEVEGSGYEPEGKILHNGSSIDPGEFKNVAQVLRAGLLCNETTVYEENGEFRVSGDPTEGALIVSAMKGGFNPEDERERYQQEAIIPFESERRYMATLNRHRGEKFIFIKGAPEEVINMCTIAMHGSDLNKKDILHVASGFAKEGIRVLAFAYKQIEEELEEFTHRIMGSSGVASGLVFAGFQGMIDPPRPEVIEAINGCKRAGIRVVMITGDHAVTAKAIAGQLGLVDESAEVLTGRELEGMTDDVIFEKVKTANIYARVSPSHKLQIIQGLLKHGEIVAVTGDGVNDAPALKAAHIGIAMGRTGTDVAKEASDMVLTDDNFTSIFSAVEEGRVVYDNVKKVTIFLVSCGVGELLAILVTIVAGMPLPYIPAQILWLNLVTNGLQDVALAFEPAEKGILNRPPLKPKEGIMSSLMIQRTALMGITLAAGTLFMFILYLKSGASLEKARSIALTTMVFFQFYQAFNCRSETQSIFEMNPMRNPFLFFSVIAAFFAQLSVIYVPALQWIFRTVPLTLTEWGQILAVSTIIVFAVEIDKWIRRRSQK